MKSVSTKSMPETNHNRHDRHLRLAARLTAESREAIVSKFTGQRIFLTADADRMRTNSGRLMLRAAANLIARFCPKIDVVLPAECSAFQTEIIAMLRKIDSSADADFRSSAAPMDQAYAAILSVGPSPHAAESLTVIDAEGWLAMLGKRPFIPQTSEHNDENPFGALMASALGAAEVFKRLLSPLPGKAFHFGETTFSTFDYSVGGNDPGPTLPNRIAFYDSLLVGAGAVGNAFLLSLAEVPRLEGELLVVDEETVDDSSNLNRYLLAFEADADPAHPTPKTQLAVRLLDGSDIRIRPFQEPLEVFVQRIYRREIMPPKVVLSAVDNNDARLVLQKLWPELLLEGATDDSLSQVSRHKYGSGLGCLLCIHDFTGADSNFSYDAHMAALSGLPEHVVRTALADASLVVTSELIRGAAEEKREFLASRVGEKVCSTFSDLEKISSSPPETVPVRATVSFVSMISGLLLAAEFVKHAAGWESPLETFFNIDSMFPLSNALVQRVDQVPTCECFIRAREIERYRRERR